MSKRSRRPWKPKARFSKSTKTASDRSPSAIMSPGAYATGLALTPALTQPGSPLFLEFVQQILGFLSRLSAWVFFDEFLAMFSSEVFLAVADEHLGVLELAGGVALL